MEQNWKFDISSVANTQNWNVCQSCQCNDICLTSTNLFFFPFILSEQWLPIIHHSNDWAVARILRFFVSNKVFEKFRTYIICLWHIELV